jgi:hypothetical protein
MKRMPPAVLLALVCLAAPPFARASMMCLGATLGLPLMPLLGHFAPLPEFKEQPILNEDTGNVSAAKTRTAILGGARAEKWHIVSNAGDAVRLRRNVCRRYTVIVDVRIHGKTVDVTHVSSENMNFRKDHVNTTRPECMLAYSTGCQGDYIHPIYGVWVTALLEAASIEAAWQAADEFKDPPPAPGE